MTARILALGTVLFTALLVQTVLVPGMTVIGLRPDFTALTVVAFALADGPGTGARYGFAAGLGIDLLSGGGPPVGVSALVLLLVGYGVGAVRPYLSGSGLPGEIAVTAVASALAIACFGLLATLLEAAAAGLLTALRMALLTAVANALFAPLLLRPLAALSRRVPGVQTS